MTPQVRKVQPFSSDGEDVLGNRVRPISLRAEPWDITADLAIRAIERARDDTPTSRRTCSEDGCRNRVYKRNTNRCDDCRAASKIARLARVKA